MSDLTRVELRWTCALCGAAMDDAAPLATVQITRNTGRHAIVYTHATCLGLHARTEHLAEELAQAATVRDTLQIWQQASAKRSERDGRIASRVIYFAGSIRGGRDDSAIYRQLIEKLGKFGNVLTEHVGSPNLTSMGEESLAREIHDRDLRWLESADFVVAEVTTPSLGVGYEIARATQWQKPVLCLFRTGTPQTLSAMIAGCPHVTIREYTTVADVDSILHDFFAQNS